MSNYQGGGYQMRIRFGGPLTRVVKALLIANGLVFVVQICFYIGRSSEHTIFERWFALTPGDAIDGLRVWQFITYSFLHYVRDPWHILANMFLLWMFGCDVERALGQRRFLVLYFGAALAGGLCMMPWYFITPGIPILGASGAVFGAMAAYAKLFPQRRLMFWGIVPVRARTLVLVFAALDLFAAVTGTDAGTAHLAHLGGFAVGWFFLSLERSTTQFQRAREFKKTAQTQREEQDVRAEVDRLLAKVGRDGLNSLTSRERAFLKRASKRFRK